MTELAQDRAELLRHRPRKAPRDIADARTQLVKVRRSRAIYGSACHIPVGREAELEAFIVEHGGTVEPEQVGSRIVWFANPPLLHPQRRVRVLGFAEGTRLPEYLKDAA